MAKWKEIVGTVAPAIATLLGSPMAGVAVRALGTTLLGDESATEDAVEQAVLQADPEALARIREADADLEARMAQAGVDLEKIRADDRASAREREKAVGSHMVNVLATIIVCAAFGVVAAVLSGWAKVDSALAGAVLGYVFSELKQVTTYFYGSSAGSKAKTAILDRLSFK